MRLSKIHIAELIALHIFSQSTTTGYHHQPCNSRAIRAQFQFDDCYLPPLSTSILLTEASFLLSHNAATGYIHAGGLSKEGVTWAYTKNQIGSVYQQLNDGARALDVRPKLLKNGTIICHHGAIGIPINFRDLVAHIVKWSQEKGQDELVLILASDFAYEAASTQSENSDVVPAIVSAMASIYKELGITYLHCSEIYGLTVGDAMDMGALQMGGYLLAMDGQDYYGSFCGKSNWVEDELVTCWGNSSTAQSCRSGSKERFEALTSYMVASANNPTTDDSHSLGPPSDRYTYPFNEVQALWQVDAHAIKVGVRHFSSILDDNRASGVNEYVVNLVYEDRLDDVSLLAVDGVAVNGNAMLSVLRSSCGQTDLAVCGEEIDPPRMNVWNVSSRNAFRFLFLAYIFWLVVFTIRRRFKWWRETVDREGSESLDFSSGLLT